MQSSKQERMLTLVGLKPSDQSVSDFCTEHQITPATFYYWQKKNRQQEPEQDAVGFAAVEVEMAKGKNKIPRLFSIPNHLLLGASRAAK